MMRTVASAQHLARARALLAEETQGSRDYATAAAEVHDKLRLRLAPLIGVAGVQALFGRSAKLCQSRFPFLDASVVGDGATLGELLRTHEPGVGTEAAAALFGTFLALLTTFIGDRLVTQVLRNAWPSIQESAVKEQTNE